MGNYSILIEGIGSHQNGAAKSDADLMVNQFIESLRSAGHTIEHASFRSHGRRETLTLIGKKRKHPTSLEDGSAIDAPPPPTQPASAAVDLLEAANQKLDDLLQIARLEAKKSTLKKIEEGAVAAPLGPPVTSAAPAAEEPEKKEEGGVETPAGPNAEVVNPEAEGSDTAGSPEESKKEEGGDS